MVVVGGVIYIIEVLFSHVAMSTVLLGLDGILLWRALVSFTFPKV